jgi:hypothetical protein
MCTLPNPTLPQTWTASSCSLLYEVARTGTRTEYRDSGSV